MANKKSLVDRFGKLPVGISKAGTSAVLDFLYSAFDQRMAKQVVIFHPYIDTDDSAVDTPELTVYEFCQWLEPAQVQAVKQLSPEQVQYVKGVCRCVRKCRDEVTGSREAGH